MQAAEHIVEGSSKNAPTVDKIKTPIGRKAFAQNQEINRPRNLIDL